MTCVHVFSLQAITFGRTHQALFEHMFIPHSSNLLKSASLPTDTLFILPSSCGIMPGEAAAAAVLAPDFVALLVNEECTTIAMFAAATTKADRVDAEVSDASGKS